MGSTLLISDLAARSGFTASTLRYYEQVGLLAATERSSGGYRLYDETAVVRLRFIDRAKQLGLPLEEIRELVAVWDGGLCAHVQEQLRARVIAKGAKVRSRIEDLTAFAGQLEIARTELAATAPDGPCGDGCGCADQRNRDATVQVPVACTLTAADQPARLAEWAELRAVVRHREAIDGGLRMRFPPDPGLAGRLADLAAREQGCCAFFTFTLRLSGQAVELDVTAPAEAAGVLRNLFGT